MVLRSGSQGDLLRGLDSLALGCGSLTNLVPRRAMQRAPIWSGGWRSSRSASLARPPRMALAERGLETVLAEAPLILPTPETSLRAGFDAMLDRMGNCPARRRRSRRHGDACACSLAADAGVAVIPPVVVRDELASGLLVELFQLPEIVEVFCAVTIRRTFPNPLLKEVLGNVRTG